MLNTNFETVSFLTQPSGSDVTYVPTFVLASDSATSNVSKPAEITTCVPFSAPKLLPVPATPVSVTVSPTSMLCPVVASMTLSASAVKPVMSYFLPDTLPLSSTIVVKSSS